MAISLKGCIVALSVVYLTLMALVLHVNAAEPAAPSDGATPGSNSYCATAFDKVVCNKVTKTAKTHKEAMTLGLKEAMKHAESIIRKSKEAKLGDSGCAKTYTNIQARLKECLELVNKDTNDEINFKLSAAVTSLEDCKDSLQQMKQEGTPFYTANRHFNHILKVCLAIDKSEYEKKLGH